ncbi:MAG: flagellar hook protein FlgE [Gammaproteobacteria bacterium]|nr:flagellar hook protein FlgE [Gammaproteobacteria bacterium]MCP5202306.1 flagellar hook protein FlgE [Gammaproteobacteria bacterium]
MPFKAAISGLEASSTELNAIGNNIANAATTGFKRSRVEFQDVFAVSSTGASATATGRGVDTARVAQQFEQGNISFTDNALDLAISGEGFFMLDNDGERIYSRDGAFGVDRDGYVTNSNGNRLMAFGADAAGNINGALGSLHLSQANNPPSATTAVSIGANFDADATPPPVAVFNPTDANTYNETTALNVFDSQGGSHLMQMYFVRSAATNTWDMHAYVDGTAVGGANSLVFDGAGLLTSPASGQITLPAFTPAAGVNAMNVNVTLTDSTMFGAPFGVSELTQDGYTTGRLAGIDIDSEGVILARFTNGQSAVQGQVALANFANPQGLRPLGGNGWSQTFAAGEVLEGRPGTASLGLIQGGALEDSNVDLSQELVALIIAQRNFQANTEVISTADAVTQSIINIR